MKKWKHYFKKTKSIAWRVYPHLKNRYVLTMLVFFIWMFFFDRNDLLTRFKLKRQLAKLKAEKEFYMKEMKEVEATNRELFSSNETLEKFAREKYLMKREDEELFLLVEKK